MMFAVLSKISRLKSCKKTEHLGHVRLAYMTINLATQRELLNSTKGKLDSVVFFHSSKKLPVKFQRVCAGISADTRSYSSIHSQYIHK